MYSSSILQVATERSDLGCGGGSFYKVEVVGWYVVGWAGSVSVVG